MTLNAALQPSVLPHQHQGTSAVERRRGPAAFRGSLERRLPASTLAGEADCLLPPVGRSEAFAEDLLDELGAAAGLATAAAVSKGRRLRLRWLGLPVLALGLGVTLGLGGLGGITGLVGF